MREPDTKSTLHWRFAKRRSHKCPITLITCDKTSNSFKHEQSHEFNAGRVKADRLINQLKKKQLNFKSIL